MFCADVPASDAAVIAVWWRIVEVCLPSHETCGAATFCPGGGRNLDADWDEWIAGMFMPLLGPSLSALQDVATSQSLDRLLAADGDLGRSLSGRAARGSLLAGRAALLDFVPPRGAKLLERLRGAAAERREAGHMATVFAVRAHVFHLPGVQVAGAYLLAECVLGAAEARLTLPAGRVAAMMQRGLAASFADPVRFVATS